MNLRNPQRTIVNAVVGNQLGNQTPVDQEVGPRSQIIGADLVPLNAPPTRVPV